jgi:ribulose-phosphate 3-epimerase
MKQFIPSKMIHQVIPGILEKDWNAIEEKIERIKPFTQAIHIDIIDGIFASNKTFLDPTPFKKYTQDIVFELHMMVDNPIAYLTPWANVGFKRFIGQIERMPDPVNFIADAQLVGEVGLAIDTTTDVDAISVSLEDLDFVFVMTVKAGFSNQSFLQDQLEKVKRLREKSPMIPIEVDGGINSETIVKAKNAGATRFVSTGYLFGSNTPLTQYQNLCQLIM